MSSASLYVTAGISASAAILGASISPVSNTFHISRQARRDRKQWHEAAVREASVALLRAAWDVLTMVTNNQEYHGAEMAARLAKVRERVADTCVQGVIIATLVHGELGHSAEQVGAAARRLESAAAQNTNLDRGVSVRAPDFGELDTAIKDFSTLIVRYWES
jgi:hypothetical protein